MKVQQHAGTREKLVLTGMIVSTPTLAAVAPIWQADLFASPWANLVGGWCVKHFARYQEAPGRDILGAFTTWAEKHSGKQELVELIEQFLTGISEELEAQELPNSAYLIDLASEHFGRVRFERLAEGIRADLDGEGLLAAQARLAGFNPRLPIGDRVWADPLTDEREVTDTFASDDTEDLITLDGALGRFFAGNLGRDCFVSFLGPEKSGKSFWLMELAYQALVQRRRVAFFEVGDMSKVQVKRRLLTRVAGHPIRNPQGRWPYEVNVPVSLRRKKDGTAVVQHEAQTFEHPLNAEMAWERCQRLMARKVRSKQSRFRLSCHPNSSINVAGIRGILMEWANEDFIPDVVVIDYADILAPPPGRMEVRDQINTAWKELRRMSQELHCLVVTATQADADSYGKELIDRRNFSEDKRKLSHVTAMWGINVTASEKEQALCRLNAIALRDGEFSVRRCVTVAQCLPLANPAVLSTF